MKRQLVLIILLLLPGIVHVSATGRRIVVALGSSCTSGDLTYDSIQLAIDSASPGDEVIICPGTYVENVVIRKSSLKIYGYGGPETVVIEAQNTSQHTFKISGTSGVELYNVTLKGAGSQMAGLYLFRTRETVIKNVITKENFYGIYVASSSAVTVENVTSFDNYDAGLLIENSIYANLTDSESYRNKVGLVISHGEEVLVEGLTSRNNTYGGILLKYTRNSTISGSNVRWNGWYGLYLQDSHYNEIVNVTSEDNNMIGNESIGIYLYQGSSNNFLHDSVIGNNVYGVVLADYSENNTFEGLKSINNSVAGFYLEWSSGNLINSSTVSGSRYGIYLMDSSRNRVENSNLSFNGWGAIIYGVDGSHNNTFFGCRIHNNTYSGAVVEENSVGNAFSMTEFWDNGLLGIDLGADLVTPNNGTYDEGPNRYVDYPVIEWAVVYGSRMLVKGYVNREGVGNGSSSFNGTVELFISDDDPTGYGEGKSYLGSLKVIEGNFLGWINLPEGTPEEFNLTGTTTTVYGTSEFGPNYPVVRVYTDLSVTKEMSPDEVMTGDLVNVTILVMNNGNGTAYNVTITDELPEGMEYVSGSSKVDGAPVEPSRSDNVLAWHLDVPANSSTVITFRARVTASPGTTLRNVAVLSQDDYNSTDDDSVNVIEEPNLRVTKVASSTSVYVGEKVTFAIRVDNLGHGTVSFNLVDELPSGLRFVKGSLRSTYPLDRLELNGTSIIAEGRISGGSSLRITYVMEAVEEGVHRNVVVLNGTDSTSSTVIVRERPVIPPGGSVGGVTPPCPSMPPGSSGNDDKDDGDDNSPSGGTSYRIKELPIVMVAVSSAGPLPPNSGTGQVVEQPQKLSEKPVARIVLEKFVTPSVASQGDIVTFIIRVKNIGNVQANEVEVIDNLPQGLDYISGTSKVGGVKDEPERSGNVLRWKIPVILPRRAVEISFRAKVEAHSGELRNEVRFKGSMAYAKLKVVSKEEPKKEEVKLPPPPPIADIKLDGQLEGGKVLYTITVTSPTGARTRVVDQLPPYLSYDPSSATVEGSFKEPKRSGNSLEWVVNVPKGGSVKITFSASLSEDFSGDKIVNRAYLPSFGKSDEHVISVKPKERSSYPSSPISLPWWLILLPLPLLVFLAARRKRDKRGVVVLDYESLKAAVVRGMLEALLSDNIIVVSPETFSKVEKDKNLMALLDKYVVSNDIRVRKVPKKSPRVKGIDEEVASAIALAESLKAPAYVTDPKIARDIRKLGFNVKLLRKDVPARLPAT